MPYLLWAFAIATDQENETSCFALHDSGVSMKLMMFGSQNKYVSLDPETSGSIDEKTATSHQTSSTNLTISRFRAAVYCFGLCILTATITTLLVFAITRNECIRSGIQQFSPAEPDSYPCGNSSAEALEAGCTFNQLLWAWLPPDCPDYANQEFIKAGDWRYYTDTHGTQRATGEAWTAAMNNEIKLYGEKGEHLSHCVFMFWSLGKIVHEGTSYPPRLVSNEHLDHCVEYLLDELRRGDGWQKMENSVGRVSYEEYCFKY